MTLLIESINKDITAVQKSEKITKALLIALSRSILQYVYVEPMQDGVKGSGDISPVNRLLKVLTPMNKQMCTLFFKNFLAWRFDDELNEFTTKNKKQFDNKLESVETFLEDENNNVFTWAQDNVKVEAKEVDYLAKLKRDLTKAFEAGITADEVLALIDELTPQDADVEAAKKAA